MQYPVSDSVIFSESPASDSSGSRQPVFIESFPPHEEFRDNFHSENLAGISFPDWYFIIILIILSSLAWARIMYGKFLNSTWASAYSYQLADKAYTESGVVQRRFGFGLDLLYLLNMSLFLNLLNLFFLPGFIASDGIQFLIQAFLILSLLVLFRLFIMRLTGFIFERSELFKGFLYHYFLYNKVIGMILIPFLFAIPYTQGKLQETLIFTGISMIILVQFFRMFRVSVYVLKNVVLLFYLILYLCILEILPVLVIIKLILSLAQV